MQTFIICLFPALIKSLRTSLPGDIILIITVIIIIMHLCHSTVLFVAAQQTQSKHHKALRQLGSFLCFG